MIPVYKELQELTKENYKGNFGLCFNKFVQIDETNFKVPDNSIPEYKKKYASLKNASSKILEKKHLNQMHFCKTFSPRYETLTLVASLISPFVTGIGQTHPSEVGMTFDHTIGIPYIPASGIKGIVRFSHTLSIIDEAVKKGRVKKDKVQKDCFDDEEDWTNIPVMFGKGGDKGNEGRVIFLDAYSLDVPDIKEDIMNSHYKPYYSEQKEAPGDYHAPVPIKFLTVENGTKFIFRVLVDKQYNDLSDDNKITDLVKKALKNSLEVEGIGAKTAVGYGRFQIESDVEPDYLIGKFEEECISEEDKLAQMKEQLMAKLGTIAKDSQDADSEFDKWIGSALKDDLEIAEKFKTVLKKKKADKSYTARYIKLSEILKIPLTEDIGKTLPVSPAESNDENEIEKIRKKLNKAKGKPKEMKKILKNCPKGMRSKLEQEFNIKE